jgi:hypothetical protein
VNRRHALAVVVIAAVAASFACAVFACVGSDPETSSAPPDAANASDTFVASGNDTGAAADASCSGQECDPKNCGRAAHDCLGGACVDGLCRPVKIAAGLKQPTILSVADGFLYWLERAAIDTACGGSYDGLVMRSKLDGSEAIKLAGQQHCPNDMLVAGGYVYWLAGGTNTSSFNDGALSRVPVGGGPVEILYPDINYAISFTTDGSTVYWVAGRQTSGTMDMWRAPLAGGGPKIWMGTLGDHYPSGMTLDPTRVFFSTTLGRIGMTSRTYAADAGMDSGASLLFLDGGSPSRIVNENAPDAGHLTWVDVRLGSVRQLPSTDAILPDGAAPVPSDLAIKLDGPRGPAISKGNVYWYTQPGDIYESPLDGSKAAVAFAKISGGTLAWVAADDTAVYVSNFVEGTIYRVAKP